MIILFRWYTKSVENIISNSKFSNSKWGYHCEQGFSYCNNCNNWAVLFTTANVSEAKADEVTANNAKDVAQQAMKTAVAIPTYRISMP